MLTTSPNSVPQKRDLHVGGVGNAHVNTLAAVTEPPVALLQAWLNGARHAAREAEYYMRENPWAALAAVAVVGVAAGFLLAQRRQG